MKSKLLFACLACSGFTTLPAQELPRDGQDYYSLQVASSKDLQAMQALYQRHADLPFVRLEQRGTLYVLRIGFWQTAAIARQAVSKLHVNTRFVRLAAYRPESMLANNWLQESSPSTLALKVTPTPPTPEPAPSRVPLPLAPPHSTPSTTEQRSERMHAFNPDDFLLAFDALLAGRDLTSAFLVAQKAVQQLPQDRPWRRRLAQVAEWTQRPQLAAQQWSALFLAGDHSKETVAAVIRLAPLMDDPMIALQAWQLHALQTHLSTTQWADVFQLFEGAAEPALGSHFFEKQYQRHKLPLLLEYAARLADHAGDDTRANALYLQRTDLDPFSMEMLLQAVVGLIRRDQLSDVLALLRRHAHQVPPDAAEYWNLLGQVAWEQGDFDSAQGAYQKLVRTQQATSGDWSRLVFLVRQQHPLEAAALAMEAYRRTGVQDLLLLSLDIYSELQETRLLQRIFDALEARTLAWAEKNTRFLLLRAQVRQHQRQHDLAWNDLRHALEIAPDQTDAVLATLWFLIDQSRTEDLAAALRRYAAQAANDPAYWLAFAAGHQVLERHSDAAVWYAKAVQNNPKDALTLLNYADALERSQREGMADRIRRHAWLLLKQTFPQGADLNHVAKRPQLLALVRMALSDQPGDPGLRLVRQLARQLRGTATNQMEDEQTRVLVLGWAIVQEQYANARDWMWLRYARQSQWAPPLWGDAQTALELKETQTMGRLLEQHGQGLPIYNRYDTAYALGHVAQALDIAFHGMDAQGDDESLHDRYRQHAPLHANYLQLRATREQLGAFEQQELRLGTFERKEIQWEAHWVATPQLHIQVGGTRQDQPSNDGNFATNLPASDHIDSLEAQWSGSRGISTLAWFQKRQWQDYTGWRLGQTLQWGGRLSLDTELNYRTDSNATTPLQLFGYENSLQASATYQLGKREYFRIAPRLTRYYTQFHDYLGSGRLLEVEAGYRIRTEYPDWRIRAYSSYQEISSDGGLGARANQFLAANSSAPISDPLGYLLPLGGTTLGACAGLGENLAGQNLHSGYSRSWRPFLDLCLSHNSEGSDGYFGFLGLAGSVTGEDHLSLQWQNSGTQMPGSPTTRSFAIRYRYYY